MMLYLAWGVVEWAKATCLDRSITDAASGVSLLLWPLLVIHEVRNFLRNEIFV